MRCFRGFAASVYTSYPTSVSTPVVTKISVGGPVYNAEATISRALDPLIFQSYREMEIIICDDDSTNDTRDICANYVRLDSRIKYHRSGINRGVPVTFAMCIVIVRRRLLCGRRMTITDFLNIYRHVLNS